jgi:hypothetical protein
MDINISSERKKRFIIENSTFLNKNAKINILTIAMMEIGRSVIMETNNKKEIDIDLDLLEKKNVEVLNHIYNIVKKRIEVLNKPAKNLINELC